MEKSRKPINKAQKEYREKNKEKLKIAKQKWRDDNKDYHTTYYLNNKTKLLDNCKEYQKNKRSVDINYRLKGNFRTMLGNAFRRNGYSKTSKSQIVLDCSFEDLKLYIEGKFEDWMSWENYGLYNGELNYGWDIDHIIPTSSATCEEDMIRLNHYTNLQPLCSKVNRDIKRDI